MGNQNNENQIRREGNRIRLLREDNHSRVWLSLMFVRREHKRIDKFAIQNPSFCDDKKSPVLTCRVDFNLGREKRTGKNRDQNMSE